MQFDSCNVIIKFSLLSLWGLGTRQINKAVFIMLGTILIMNVYILRINIGLIQFFAFSKLKKKKKLSFMRGRDRARSVTERKRKSGG